MDTQSYMQQLQSYNNAMANYDIEKQTAQQKEVAEEMKRASLIEGIGLPGSTELLHLGGKLAKPLLKKALPDEASDFIDDITESGDLRQAISNQIDRSLTNASNRISNAVDDITSQANEALDSAANEFDSSFGSASYSNDVPELPELPDVESSANSIFRFFGRGGNSGRGLLDESNEFEDGDYGLIQDTNSKPLTSEFSRSRMSTTEQTSQEATQDAEDVAEQEMQEMNTTDRPAEYFSQDYNPEEGSNIGQEPTLDDEESNIRDEYQPGETDNMADVADVGETAAETGAETAVETGVETGAEVGGEIAADAALEGIGAGLDATGVLAPIGAVLGIIGLAGLGTSIGELFGGGSSESAPAPPDLATPVLEAGV